MSEINYVCCRWRDAITDPPPEGKPHVVRANRRTIQHTLFERFGSRWTHADLQLEGDSEGWDGCDIHEGDQWLDVTDIPAVAVAKVQAAVDEMDRLEDLAAKRNTEFWHGREDGLLSSMIVIHNHTGVTPKGENHE